jgi:hypothetical protein
MDITAADAPPGTLSTDDSERPRSGATDSSGLNCSLEVSDDSWIEDWDMTIHRCSHCDRPFVSAARLTQHLQEWHTGGAPGLRPYQKPPSGTGAGSGELVVIAPHGDLFLSVSEGSAWSRRKGVRFQVSSSILCMASRVFNSMFGPTSRFQEAIALRRSHISGFPPVVVALDDDLEALKFVLTTLHFSHDLSSPTYRLMVGVAAVCDKYELHRALQPVADLYFLPIGMKVSNFAQSSNWLLISYVFGYEQIFAAVSKYIILHLTDAKQTATIDWRTPAKVTGMTRFGPPSTSAIAYRVTFSNPEALAAKRNSLIDRLVLYLEAVRKERLVARGQVAPAVRCRQPSMKAECEALQLGNLEGNLLRHGLPEAVRTTCVHTICDEVALFVPLSVGFDNYDDYDDYNDYNRNNRNNRNNYNNNLHQACSWVPAFKLAVSSLLSSAEGLKLEDIPSSMRAHK